MSAAAWQRASGIRSRHQRCCDWPMQWWRHFVTFLPFLTLRWILLGWKPRFKTVLDWWCVVTYCFVSSSFRWSSNRKLWLWWNFLFSLSLSIYCNYLVFCKVAIVGWTRLHVLISVLFALPVLRSCAIAMAQSLKPNFYSVELNRTEWKVPKRYQKLTPVGSGAYGQVWLVVSIDYYFDACIKGMTVY